MLPSFIQVDIEPTNRCNADCYFCPRDRTPDEGMLEPEIFHAALGRTIELRDITRETLDMDVKVTLCGLGEPLINKHTPAFVEAIRNAGLPCTMSSNAALLNEEKGRRLLDAGLQAVHINVGERDEGYVDIYKLPWERTRDNILAFHEMAGDDCEVHIVLVDHRQDREHVKSMVRYWKKHGINRFLTFDIMNRGGALVVDEMSYADVPEVAQAQARFDAAGGLPQCLAPFVFPFVGYDGQIYLCCSDWTKTAPFGSVLDTSFVDTVFAKHNFVSQRSGICQTCNLDPRNRVTDELRGLHAGEVDESTVDQLITTLVEQGEMAERLRQAYEPLAKPSSRRRSIPVTAVPQ
jgi:MoaA/NifB/PqqE/SkfB family radical SAM enzyme